MLSNLFNLVEKIFGKNILEQLENRWQKLDNYNVLVNFVAANLANRPINDNSLSQFLNASI